MGERMLSKYQFGVESSRGTAVASTRVLGAGVKGVPLDRVWDAVRYSKGSRANAQYKRNDNLLVQDSLTFDADNPLYFQALPVFHQCSLDGDITPTEQTGSQSDYLWAVAPSLTAANAPDTVTLELGDDTQAFEIEYTMFNRLMIAGQIPSDGSAAPVTGEFGYFGRQVTPTTFTAAQTLHSGLELMNASLARFYKDTAWGSLGGTEIAALRGFELEILVGNHPKKFGSANKYFTTHGEGMITAMLTVDLEGIAAADTVYDEYQAGSERAIRLAITGSQIGSGATYKYQVDIFGYWAEVVPLNEEREGNNVHRALFVSKEDASANFLDIDIITNHNAL